MATTPTVWQACVTVGRLAVAAATASGEEQQLRDGDRFGPLTAIPTPGHCPDHLAFVAGGVCFTGDAVLGQGSVFVAPAPGALAGYLNALRDCARWTSTSCAPATARRSSTREPSSTSTSTTASTASAGWSKR